MDKKAFKATLNLPQTKFPMRGNMGQREPELLRQWSEQKLYDRIDAATKGRPLFVLHDGPPYANGRIHYGHILNKVLKDIVVKYRTMAGHRSPLPAGLGLPRPAHRAAGRPRPGPEEGPR